MRIRVLGAGIVGLSVADELLRRGHEVDVVDPAPASGASRAAAGMLSPAGEVWHGEPELFDLGGRSLALWPEYAARLDVSLHETGTLLVGVDAGDLQQVERRVDLLDRHGVVVRRLGGREVRAAEPRLTARAAGGALLPGDHSVDPRAVLRALLDRLPVLPSAPPDGVDVTVIATGAGLPEPFTALVRPVRGEILRAHTPDPPGLTVRAEVHGEPVYVVPRPSGEVVIGATSEEHDGEPRPTVGGVARLLWAARELMPGLETAELVETLARDRPGTRDNRPLVGPSGRDGVVLAAGHFRHGVLLAPLTAALVADHLENGRIEPALDPRRFERSPACT
jgi:glycine oxidase